MKKLFIFLLWIVIIAYGVNRFDLINKYRLKQPLPTDTTTIEPGQDPPKKISENKLRKKRPRHTDPYQKLDQYAFQTPSGKSKSIGELAKYLSAKATNDYEKARLAYAWIASHIAYDDESYNTGNYGDMSAQGVFKNKKAVCDGYSSLYKTLCDSMGLEAVKISGYAKGYGYTPGEKLRETDHAWNAVKLNNQWKLVDATWGAGYGETANGKLKSVKKYNSYWFATNPYEFLFKHLPEENRYQLIISPISKTQYEQLAYTHNELFELGIPAKTVLAYSLANPSYQAPDEWMPDYELQILQADLHKSLRENKTYEFKIKSPEELEIFFINQEKWIGFKKENDLYSCSIKPQKGPLKVSVRLNGFETNYSTILQYEVE